MGKDPVIVVERLSKKFCWDLRRSMYYGAIDVAKSMIGLRLNCDILRREEFWAVQNVSFVVGRGETLAIMGANGSGKSTLLRLLNGIYEPDTGRVEIRARVGALLALGAGFHPLMTGRENIYVNSSVLGMRRREIDENFDRIVDFAGIGEFIDAPVKTYSSGMQVRLGFAIAIQSRPDILLVDEILAVGDASFQKRCFETILGMINRGTTMVLVSHSVGAVERLCTRGLLLKQGRAMFLGSSRECVQRYFYEISQDNLTDRPMAQLIGVGDVVFSDVSVYQDGGDRNDRNIEFGRDIAIQFCYEFLRKISERNQVRVSIRSYEGREVQKMFFQDAPFIDEVVYRNEKIVTLGKSGTVKIRVLNPRLFPQTFRLDLAMAPLDMDFHLGGIADAALFNIVHPKTQDRYLEFGNLTITEFDYEIEVT